MDCRTTSAHKFRTRLGFNQYDAILKKEQSVLTKVMSSFEWENMQTQYIVLSYRIDLYFHDYKLTIEIDENGHSNRNIDYKIKRQKAINKNLIASVLELILTKNNLTFSELSMEYLDMLNNQLKNFNNKISTRLLPFESKAIKLIVVKILPDYK